MDTVLVGKLFGINVVPIPGYKRSPEIKLAIQRGDVAASIHDPPLIRSEVREGLLRLILFMGSGRAPLLPQVPTAKEVGVEEIIPLQRMMRLIVAPPGLPKDVEDVLSGALWKALNDESLLSWAKKVKYPITPMNSNDLKQSMLEVSKNHEKYIDYIKNQLKE